MKDKRLKSAAEKVDADRLYPLSDAVALVKETASAKFDETVEAAMQLGVDARKSDQSVRGAAALPAGSGRVARVAVVAKDAAAEAAREAGADKVGFDDLIEEIKKGALDFDVLIATPDAMRTLSAVARILGPKGLMPNPKSGTVAADAAAAVKRAKSGEVRYRADRGGIVHAPVGRASFSADDLERNIVALIDSVKRAKPSASKGIYLRKLALSCTMGPGVAVDISRYR